MQHSQKIQKFRRCCQFYNFSGNPAATLPCGFSSKGLPISLQIAGAKEDEVGVLQASRAFEIVRPWHGKKPVV